MVTTKNSAGKNYKKKKRKGKKINKPKKSPSIVQEYTSV